MSNQQSETKPTQKQVDQEFLEILHHEGEEGEFNYISPLSLSNFAKRYKQEHILEFYQTQKTPSIGIIEIMDIIASYIIADAIETEKKLRRIEQAIRIIKNV